MNQPVYFEIHADDTDRAVNFYDQVFGWKFTLDPNLPVPYWRIETAGIGGGLLMRPVERQDAIHGTNAFICTMEVENFDATAAKIAELGGQEALPKFAVPGKCWQGYFLDSEGNTFGIMQVDKTAA